MKQMSGECWLYAKRINKFGYAEISAKVNGSNRNIRVHRIMYEAFIGDIPKGLVIDHLCRVTQCINPDHLEAVTVRENTMRGVGIIPLNASKTHCPAGHPYSGRNLNFNKHGWRLCRSCIAVYAKRYQARLKAKAETPLP